MSETVEQLSKLTQVRDLFATKGFVFTQGKLKERPRFFGVARGCTLELIGDAEIERATMVGVMAPDQIDLAKLNAICLTALMALLAGEAGAKWCSGALAMMAARPALRQFTEGMMLGYKLRMIVDRSKSSVTLQIRRGQE